MDPQTLTVLARNGQAIATARAFRDQAQATRVVLLIDRGPIEPALMVECELDTEVTDGDATATIPRGQLVPAEPLPLPEIRPIPSTAITIDTGTGELSAPIGAIEHLAQSLKQLAQVLGGRSVVTAEFATSDTALPITIAARSGEPALLEAAGEQFELP